MNGYVMSDFKVGDRVKIPVKNATGKIVFIGKTHFSKGLWFGIVLDKAKGRHNGIIDGVCYFNCPRNHGIFVKSRLIEKVIIGDTGTKENKRNLIFKETNNLSHQKSQSEMSTENRPSAQSGSEDISKTQVKSENCKDPGNTKKVFKLPASKESTNVHDVTYVLHSSSSNIRIKYPNYLKASSKIKAGSHVCVAKLSDSNKTRYPSFAVLKRKREDGVQTKKPITNLNLYAVERDIKELKNKLRALAEGYNESLPKYIQLEEEIELLKDEMDCQKTQMNFLEYNMKLLETSHHNLLNRMHFLEKLSAISNRRTKYSESQPNRFNNSSFISKFDLEHIKSMIVRQQIELQKQEKKTLQGLLEIQEFLNANFKSYTKKMDASGDFFPQNDKPCTSLEHINSSVRYEGSNEESSTKPNESTELLPETTQLRGK